MGDRPQLLKKRKVRTISGSSNKLLQLNISDFLVDWRIQDVNGMAIQKMIACTTLAFKDLESSGEVITSLQGEMRTVKR